MTKRITLTRKGFREWLVGKHPRAHVGSGSTPWRCPVANYLRNLGIKRPSVGVTTFSDRDVGLENKMPKWANKFIRSIDAKKPSSITARQALAVLDGKEPTDA